MLSGFCSQKCCWHLLLRASLAVQATVSYWPAIAHMPCLRRALSCILVAPWLLPLTPPGQASSFRLHLLFSTPSNRSTKGSVFAAWVKQILPGRRSRNNPLWQVQGPTRPARPSVHLSRHAGGYIRLSACPPHFAISQASATPPTAGYRLQH
ncbi:hypothetical protein BDP55DRAFT_642805 [Colletotrichum godetiae]|uniref:Uncharacterized protein n=1 Tax=Colletotrichum godetiae TaxID=1209918 RepID=A0AAJ0F4E6_9PEZI|nr:uncharacterized protein BDP55DRAFT_642805 [Colletotrichum godetiae]KAK1700396.1 hypothetical protein BDP55DRAFT_642805 [Colletotrichum godetiae]